MTFVAPPPHAFYTDTVDAAFGYTRDTDPATWVWTDISSYVRGGITIFKGRPDATSTADPTRISLTLENTDGRFTKGNPSSPYWPNVVRGVPIRVRRAWKNSTTSYERGVGFVAGWPTTPQAGLRYVTCDIEAFGRLRWLRRDTTLVASPLRRTFGLQSPTAYWSLEDGVSATRAASAVTGVAPLRPSGAAVTFGVPGPNGAASGINFTSGGSLSAVIPGATTGSVELAMAVRLTDINTLSLQVKFQTSTGLIFMTRYSGTSPAYAEMNIYSEQIAGGFDTFPFQLPGTPDTGWHLWQFTLVQNGANIEGQFFYDGVSLGSFTGASGFAGLTLGRVTQTTLGPPTTTAFVPDYELSNVMFITPAILTPTDTASLFAAFTGHDGESATTRIARLGTENSITVVTSAGTLGTPQPLGPQGVDTLGNLLDAAANADCGLLHDGGTLGGLYYASPGARYNAAAQLTVAYAASQISDGFAGTDDDQTLTNDVTITRVNGSSGNWANAASVATEGRITGQDTLNLANDQQPDYIAQFRANLSSFDAMRFPVAPIDVRRNPELALAVTSLTLPAYIAIPGVPSPFPPGALDQFGEGYTETLDVDTWRLDFNCTPAAPYRIAVVADPTNPWVVDAGDSTLAASLTTTAVSATVGTSAGPQWSTSGGDYPRDLAIDGEVVRATAAASWLTDAFGRTTASSWGSADTGQAYTNTGGAAADFSVSSGTGRHSLTSVNVSRWSTVTAPSTDIDYYISASTSVLATGGSQFVAATARWADANNNYLARLDFSTTQTVTLTIRKRVTGTETQLATVDTGLTHAAATLVRIRFQVIGTTLRAKAWLASGSEPADWQLTVVDSDLSAAGSLGARSILSSANTNTLPVTVQYDDAALVNPQAVTLTRAVNGVVKAHSAGAKVSLYRPATIAL